MTVTELIEVAARAAYDLNPLSVIDDPVCGVHLWTWEEIVENEPDMADLYRKEAEASFKSTGIPLERLAGLASESKEPTA